VKRWEKRDCIAAVVENRRRRAERDSEEGLKEVSTEERAVDGTMEQR
jgi:hypothetical protein